MYLVRIAINSLQKQYFKVRKWAGYFVDFVRMLRCYLE